MKDIEDPEKVSEGKGKKVGRINKTDDDLDFREGNQAKG